MHKIAVMYEACTFADATHYYHGREDAFFPIARLNDIHNGHCVMPVKVVSCSSILATHACADECRCVEDDKWEHYTPAERGWADDEIDPEKADAANGHP